MKGFGKRLIELRVNRKVMQKSVAELLGVTPRQMQNYEKDLQEPSLTQLVQIACFYQVSTDFLLGLTDQE